MIKASSVLNNEDRARVILVCQIMRAKEVIFREDQEFPDVANLQTLQSDL